MRIGNEDDVFVNHSLKVTGFMGSLKWRRQYTTAVGRKRGEVM